jgi:phosphotransferase system HPr (HPr) family protein
MTVFLLAPTTDPHWTVPKAITRTLTVTHQLGLHLRPCSAIVLTVGRHLAKVTIQKGSQLADAASILDLLMLAAPQGTELVLSATGPEAEKALEAVAGLFDSKIDLADCH